MLKITFQLFERDALAFAQYAAICGGRSALVRWMVGELLSGRLNPPTAESLATVQATRHNLVEFALTEDEASAIDAACKARGMSRARWIHALIRCRLGAPAAFSRGDRIALRQTTRTLKTLSGDIKRLRLESKLSNATSANAARLAAIDASLERLAKTIRVAVDGSELYWSASQDASEFEDDALPSPASLPRPVQAAQA